MKTKTIISITITLLLGIIIGYMIPNKTKLKTLPKPSITEGQRGQLGIDKNINEETIDNYLGREDSVYRDMRMLKDPGNYEAIGGDSYLSGIVKGFEVVPYPYLTEVKGLPKEVGDSYKGKTLFKQLEDGTYKANYKESLELLEYLFPKDKNIFLMCGGGGYAGMTKQLLVSLGWDENKIYNVGGYWYYNGKNNIEIKNNNKYDFWKVTYHDIDFKNLTEAK
jgi:rhodanese-related sulfurtransferase